MNNMLLNLYVKLQSLTVNEEGQDLVEYALALMLVATATVAMLGSMGQALLGEYKYIVAKLDAAFGL